MTGKSQRGGNHWRTESIQAFHQAIPKRSALFLFFAYKEARRKKLDCKTRWLRFLAALIQTHMGYHKVQGGGKAALQLAARDFCLNLSGHPLRAVWWQGKKENKQCRKAKIPKERGPLAAQRVSRETTDPATGLGRVSSEWGNGKFQRTKG